ncbi:MAG: ArsR family transcriptional regulator [Planctomycetes bacterium]|nr:ArsR family transcriptional regulator [Planctomycetota bacterium]
MPERIATVCRALASEPNLIILHQLALEPDLASSELARRARLSRPQTSSQLSHLAALGALSRRRSGPFVHYSIADEPGNPGSFAPWRLVRETLASPARACRSWRADSILHLSEDTVTLVGEPVARAMDVIFDAATAFGNVRRVQLVRLLRQQGPCTGVGICGTLRISPYAFWRHIRKLQRRGYVRQRSPGLWQLTRTHKALFHHELFGIVVKALS